MTTPYLALQSAKSQLQTTRYMIASWEERVATAPLYSVARDLMAELDTLRIIAARLDFDVYQGENDPLATHQ